MKKWIALLIVMLAAAPPLFAASATNFIATVVASTSTNSTVIVAANATSNPRARWTIMPQVACHVAFDTAATTNHPQIAAASAWNDQTPDCWQGSIALRSTTTNATTCYVWIFYK